MSIPSSGLGNGRRIGRLSTVIGKTGLSRTTLWRLERAGAFPARIWLSANAVCWDLDEIDEWIAERAAECTVAMEAPKHELSDQALSGARAEPSALPHTRRTPEKTPPPTPDVGEGEDERCDRVGVAAQKQEGGAS